MICIIGDESRIGFPIAAFFSLAFALSGNTPAAPAVSPRRAQCACAFFRRLLPFRAIRLRLRLFHPGGLNTPALFFRRLLPYGQYARRLRLFRPCGLNTPARRAAFPCGSIASRCRPFAPKRNAGSGLRLFRPCGRNAPARRPLRGAISAASMHKIRSFALFFVRFADF